MPDEMKRVTVSAALKPEERRKHPRYPFTAAAEVVEPKADARVTARSSDLAIGGCFIDAMSPFPIGTSVVVRLAYGQRNFEAKARVAYSQNGMGMGLAFTEIESSQKWILEQWLGELSGQPVTKLKVVETERAAAQAPAAGGSDEPRYVLNELIVTLIRKGVLTDKEGKALLQKLMS